MPILDAKFIFVYDHSHISDRNPAGFVDQVCGWKRVQFIGFGDCIISHGKVTGQDIKFHVVIGDFGEGDLLAKRAS